MNKIIPLDIEKNDKIVKSEIVYKKKYKCDCCFDDTKDVNEEYRKCLLIIFGILIFLFSIGLGLTIYGMNNWNIEFFIGFQICIGLSIPIILFLIIFFIHL